mmetsp:Transcript_60234/g.142719  ORF Transcript_60234/g.142719 Transcript_60234/m.142719 type:complete len:153 (+) Transcript_60234:2-460(+)
MLRRWRDVTKKEIHTRARLSTISKRWFGCSKKDIWDQWKRIVSEREHYDADRIMKLRLRFRFWVRYQKRKAGMRDQQQVLNQLVLLKTLRKCITGFRQSVRSGVARTNRMHLEAYFGVQRVTRVLRSSMHSWCVAVFLEPNHHAHEDGGAPL